MSAGSRAPALVLAALAATAAVVLLVLAHPLTFFVDEWEFITQRREWNASTFLEPHNEHISIIPVAVYKLLLTAFGMESQAPFQVALTAIVIANAILVFAWVRRRVGDWLALAAAVPLLFLGSSAFNLLWSFQVTLMGSMAFGLGALLALDRDDPRGDRLACALLVGSIATHSPGLAFTAGVAAGVLWRSDRRRRAYIFLVPLGLYLLWWLGWGVAPAEEVTVDRIIHAPIYVLNGFGSSIASLLGLVVDFGGNPIDPLRWGRPLLVIAIGLVAWRLWTVRRISASLATVLGIGIAFWAVSALSAGVVREPTNGRYQYLGAVFVILIAAELWRGARPGRAAVGLALAVAALAAAGNLRAFEDPRNFLKIAADGTRVRLAAAEIAGPLANPAAMPTDGVTLGPYLEAVRDYGSPALDGEELAAAEEPIRAMADSAFAELYGLEASDGGGTARGRCAMIPPGAPSTVVLSPGGAAVAARDATALALRRYAAVQFPVDLGEVAGGESVAIQIPADGSDVPWALAVTSAEPVRVCALANGAPGSAG